MNEAPLRLSGVSVDIGEARLLDDVWLVLEPGTICAVVGPNGAGKTTLLDAISGMVVASGSVEIAGSANGFRVGDPRAGVGRVFQGSPLPETLTVAECIGLVSGGRASTISVLDRFGLRVHATSFVAELSTGMRRILDLAIATIASPSVLLLDEPASGLAQSEVEHLAALIRRWRDDTGSIVIVVEHDAWLVREIADEVIALEGGRVVAHDSAKKVLARKRRGVRLHSPQEEHFKVALSRVTSEAAPAPGLPRRTLSKWTLMRLGLREMSAGMSSVLILSVLTRTLHVELGITLGVVTAVLASYNLSAPIAVAIGHRSDTKPLFGRRRTSYIVIGAALTGLAVAGAPHVASRLAGGVSVGAIALSVLLFAVMGLGMYGSGTVFFALIADKSGPADRGHAASVVYLELMVGVLAGVVLTGAVLKNDGSNIGTLFGLAGLLVFIMSTVAVWGQEPSEPPAPADPAAERPTLRASIRSIAQIPQARRFFAFMVLSTLFLFLQQAVLTSFGGDVLGLSVRSTSGFSAILTIGTIVGMIIAGRPFAEQAGYRKVAIIGLAGSVLGFAVLATAAGARSAAPAWLAILFLGFASGLFNVSTLALMMSMADRKRTALFMGAWTLAHALADGAASAGGGSFFELFHKLFNSLPGGYAAVFAIEAAGLAICIPLLRTIDPSKFASEAHTSHDFVPAMMDPSAVGDVLAETLETADRASAPPSNGADRPAPRPRTPSRPKPPASTRVRAAKRPPAKRASAKQVSKKRSPAK